MNAVENGMSKSEAARVFKVSRTAVHHWTKAAATEGAKALRARKRGRPKCSRLLPYQAAMTVRLMEQALSRLFRLALLPMDSRCGATISSRTF